MPLLDVPHIRQSETGWCLPACVAMVSAWWQQPLTQDDIARWLGTRAIGTPAGKLHRLVKYGFEVTYGPGSLDDLAAWLKRDVPSILFVRTVDLSYWAVDTPHAVVLVGLDEDNAYLLDPDVEVAPVRVTVDELMLAWGHFDYTYAALRLESE